MKTLLTLAILLLISLLTVLSSCSKPDEPSTEYAGLNPFSNGGSERNMIVVISDIHLGPDLSYSELNANLGAFERWLRRVKTAPDIKELVIAGDMLDEWFIPATMDTYQGKDQADFVKRIAATNKAVFDAINSIIQEGKIRVTYIPGNHDMTITAANVESILPGINQAREAELGLGRYTPAGCPTIVIEHGHRYNFFSAPDPLSNQDIAPGSILPPGYFFSRIVAQHIYQNHPLAGDTMKIVTQNTVSGNDSQYLLYIYWKVWQWGINYVPLASRHDAKIIITNINGYSGTYSINDILPFQTTPGGFIDVKLYKGMQDKWIQRQILNHVAVAIPAAQSIGNSAKSIESYNQAKMQYFLNPDSDKRIVIFGHSHDAAILSCNNHDGLKSIYANTGTWIDQNDVGPTVMNFIVVTPQNSDISSLTYVKLYNFENEVVTEMAADSLRY